MEKVNLLKAKYEKALATRDDWAAYYEREKAKPGVPTLDIWKRCGLMQTRLDDAQLRMTTEMTRLEYLQRLNQEVQDGCTSERAAVSRLCTQLCAAMGIKAKVRSGKRSSSVTISLSGKSYAWFKERAKLEAALSNYCRGTINSTAPRTNGRKGVPQVDYLIIQLV